MRENRGPYYTRSYRRGGRVCREYCGGGLAGILAEDLDAEERAEREQKQAAWRAEKVNLRAGEQLTAEVCELTQLLVEVTLVLAGYRRHNRGEWRRKREQVERDQAFGIVAGTSERRR